MFRASTFSLCHLSGGAAVDTGFPSEARASRFDSGLVRKQFGSVVLNHGKQDSQAAICFVRSGIITLVRAHVPQLQTTE